MDETTLITDNVKLVGYFAHRLQSKAIPHYYFELDDIYQEGCIGLIKAARSFKPEKGIKFSTYAARCIQNEIKMYFRKESSKKKISIPTLDAPLPEQADDSEKLCYKDLLSTRHNRYAIDVTHFEVEGEILAAELKTFYDDLKKFPKLRSPHVEEREKKVFELLMEGYKQIEMVPILGVSQRITAQHFAVIRERIKEHWMEECS